VIGEVQCWGGQAAFLPSGVFGLGIVIWDASERGKGHGREAQRQMVDRLFRDLGARRVQAGTNPRNEPERRCLVALGFRKEGTMRSFFPGQDGAGDIDMYALLRDEWETTT
jgi:RimJ/RimL family protein N-acetyltransferase